MRFCRRPHSASMFRSGFWWPLLEGATLVVARPGGHQDPDYLATLIEAASGHYTALRSLELAVFLDEERAKHSAKSIRSAVPVCAVESALPAELAQRVSAACPAASFIICMALRKRRLT